MPVRIEIAFLRRKNKRVFPFFSATHPFPDLKIMDFSLKIREFLITIRIIMID